MPILLHSHSAQLPQDQLCTLLKGGEISPYAGLVHLLSAGPCQFSPSPSTCVPNILQALKSLTKHSSSLWMKRLTLSLCWVNWKLKYSDNGMSSPDYNHLNFHLLHHTFLQFQKKVSLFLLFKATFWYLWACSISYSVFGPHLHLFLLAGSFS